MRIFEFLDYRVFLRQYILELPKNGRGEINRLAEAAGIHPSLVSQILNKEKNLSLEQAQAIAAYLNLTSLETEYLLNLVLYQRAGTHSLREYFKNKIDQIKHSSLELTQYIKQDHELNEEEKSVLYSHWLYIAIWLYCSIENGKSLEEISNHFSLSRERSLEILNFLVTTSLCWIDGSHYKMKSQSIHISKNSPHLYRHHINWRLKAIANCDQIEKEELMYTAPISISVSDFKNIRRRLAELIKETTTIALDSKPENIAYLGLDFFWIKK